jgi:hypothetical protein
MEDKTLTIYIANGISEEYSVIPQAGATIQGFPSGLFRVDQEFFVPNKFASQARERFAVNNTLSDGANFLGHSAARIFPAPKESREVPGFTKFTVSAYGFSRKFTEFIVTKGMQIVAINQSFTQDNDVQEEPPFNWTISEKWLISTVTTSGVISNGTNIPPRSGVTPPAPTLVNRQISGTLAPGGQTTITVNWQFEIAAITRRNFGFYDEYDLTESLIPYY